MGGVFKLYLSLPTGGKPSLNQANFGGVYGRDAKDATALIGWVDGLRNMKMT